MKIAVLVLDHVFDTGLATVLDALSTANELAGETRFEVSVVGVRARVSSGQGLTVPVVPFTDCPHPDWVIVPAIATKMPEQLRAALSRGDVADAGLALRNWSASGASIAASCIGTFILAESGLLNGERATTTWWLAPFFRERYPEVQLESDRMIVPSGRFLTAGAALSHIDMT
ncbi:MAG: DJ-1/PfpI family protein, partial [Bradyrhizobium sp.]